MFSFLFPYEENNFVNITSYMLLEILRFFILLLINLIRVNEWSMVEHLQGGQQCHENSYEKPLHSKWGSNDLSMWYLDLWIYLEHDRKRSKWNIYASNHETNRNRGRLSLGSSHNLCSKLPKTGHMKLVIKNLDLEMKRMN